MLLLTTPLVRPLYWKKFTGQKKILLFDRESNRRKTSWFTRLPERVSLVMENLIKLTVKTPNQRIDDIQIDCDLQWTVRKLKDYLQDVYPSNPVSIFIICDTTLLGGSFS